MNKTILYLAATVLSVLCYPFFHQTYAQVNNYLPQGAFTGASCSNFSGWAIDNDVPSNNILVDFWMVKNSTNNSDLPSWNVYLGGTNVNTSANPTYPPFSSFNPQRDMVTEGGLIGGGMINEPRKYFFAGVNRDVTAFAINVDSNGNRLDGPGSMFDTNLGTLTVNCNQSYPNCKNLSGPTTVTIGQTYSYSAIYEYYNGPLDRAGITVVNQGTCTTHFNNWTGYPVPPGTYTFSWTPGIPGNYTMYCRGWNDSIAECRGTCVDFPPRYQCPGPNTTLNIIAAFPTPTPTRTPTPVPTSIPLPTSTPTSTPRSTPTSTPIPTNTPTPTPTRIPTSTPTRIPTPTPTPTTLPTPPPPVNLSGSCPVPGTQATVSWSSVSSAHHYALRVDDMTDPWNETCTSANGDFCTDVTITSYSFNTIPGHIYAWWVHTLDVYGQWSPAAHGTNFSCVIAATPTSSPTPTSTPRPTPTSTPVPTNTPTPTPTSAPAPTSTPRPTAAPVPTATSYPTPSPYPTSIQGPTVVPGITLYITQPPNTFMGRLDLTNVVQFIFSLLVAIGIIAALSYLMYGAIRWITSGGDKALIESSRSHITHAVIGLIILILSWVIVSLIMKLLGAGSVPTAVGIPSLS